MGETAVQITGVSIVFSTACSGQDQRNHQRAASLAFVREYTVDRRIPLLKTQ